MEQSNGSETAYPVAETHHNYIYSHAREKTDLAFYTSYEARQALTIATSSE